VLGLAGAAAIGGLATAAQASTSHITDSPPPPSLPGFSAVITSVTVGPAGKIIGPFTVQGASVELAVPPGAFPANVQVTITKGDLDVLAGTAFAGFTLDTAVGVQAELNGALYPGTFLKPLTLMFRDPAITAASVAAIWNGVSLMAGASATATPGVLSVSFDSDPDFAVMSPKSARKQEVPKATAPATGKPVAGEGIAAGVLLALGAGGLAAGRRRIRS
jgi:hypothetical protein